MNDLHTRHEPELPTCVIGIAFFQSKLYPPLEAANQAVFQLTGLPCVPAVKSVSQAVNHVLEATSIMLQLQRNMIVGQLLV
jgi:hypothetical protein